MITNDAVVFGILISILAFVFYTSSSKNAFWQKFYKFVPSLLLCYFIPSLFNSAGIISGDASSLYYMASRYLLPASLVLLCLGIDFKGIVSLGPKALVMFLAGTLGIVVGGPLAILVTAWVDPTIIAGQGPEEVWRGLATLAGSWIGGGANQTAMKEVYGASDALFSAMITVDVIVANIWMACLLLGAGYSDRLDRIFKADNSAIDNLKRNVENYQSSIARIPSLTDLMVIAFIGLGCTGFSHFLADWVTPFFEGHIDLLDEWNLTTLASGFFWLVVFATTFGLALSFTKMKSYEGAGASRIGSAFLYILVATIGMKMDILAIFDNPGLFLIGGIWMAIHATVLLSVGKLIKAPFFFTAVGSQANVGGAASAPIVASAFSPALAPVGVLLAVLGYALGTYMAIVCAQLMQVVSPGG